MTVPRRFRARLFYWAYRAAVPLAALVPPAVAYPILDRIGDVQWLLHGSARRYVEANLLRVIGRPGVRWRRAVRETFRHGARNYYDTFRVSRLTAEEVIALVPMRGWEHLEAAAAEGRGVIILSAHISSVALTSQIFVARGYPVTVPVERIEPPELLRLLSRARSGLGNRVVPLGPRVGAQLSAALRRGELVGLIADRDVTGTGVVLPFFGAPTRMPSGAALLSLRTGAPILLAIAVRTADDHFDGTVEPPIRAERTRESRAEVERVTRTITARLEYYIGRNPEQWTVFQPIWPATDQGGRSS